MMYDIAWAVSITSVASVAIGRRRQIENNFRIFLNSPIDNNRYAIKIREVNGGNNRTENTMTKAHVTSLANKYLSALVDFGPNNMATQRAEIAWHEADAKYKSQRLQRASRDKAMRDCGLTKVRGALGGVYWE
jgi:hypothetical protein